MEGGYPDVAVADEPTLPPTPASNQVAIDLTSGALGGAAGLLVGHPFDTVKVKMQNAPPGQPPVSAFAVARNTLRDQGLARGLYRGMAVPMGTVALFNAVLFATNGAMKRVVEKVTGRKPADFGVREYAMCGMGAGVAVSLVATPTELIKCRLQAPGPGVVYTGPMDVARQVWNARGLVGLYKGLFPTFYREIPGNMLYFAFYEGVKLSMLKEGQTTADLSQMQVLLAGGIGGLAFWGGVYPTDIIKTRIQTDSDIKPRYRNALHCARTIVAEEGARALFKGAGPCLARAFPANAVCFLTYETFVNYFSSRT